MSKRIARGIKAIGHATAEAAHAAADAMHSAVDKAHDVGEQVAASKAVANTKEVAQAVGQKAAGAGLAVGGAAAGASHSVVAKVVQAGVATGSATVAVGQGVKTTAVTAGTAIGHGALAAGEVTLGVATGAGRVAVGAGQAAIEKTVDATVAVGRVAHGAGHAVAEKASQAGTAAAQSAHPFIAGATQRTGQVAAVLIQNAMLQGFIKTLKADGVLDLVARVDLDKAQATVQELKQRYADDTPEQLARRLTSVASGAALALMKVDWSVTALLQAELVAQIACAYGLDVHDPARKGEFIAIFGLALGSERALEVGLELLRPIPVAGALVAVLSSASLVYLLGHAARRF